MSLALATVGYEVASAAWIRPYLYVRPDRVFVVAIDESAAGRTDFWVPRSALEAWTQRLPRVQFAWYDFDIGDVEVGHASRPVVAVKMSANMLQVLGLQPAMGAVGEEPDQVITGAVLLAHRSWQREWSGDMAVIGRTMRFQGTIREVIGVAPSTLALPFMMAPPFYVLAGTNGFVADRVSERIRVLARVPDGVPTRDVESVLTGLAAAQGDSPSAGAVKARVRFVPLTAVGRAVVPGASFLTVVLFATVALAFTNVMHLILQDYLSPVRVNAWRTRCALGATPAHVTKAALRDIVGLGAATALVTLGLAHTVVRVGAEDFARALVLPRQPVIDQGAALCVIVASFGLVAICVCVAVVALAGRLAFVSWNAPDPTGGRTSPFNGQRWLIGTQLICATALFAVAAEAGMVFGRLITVDPGMNCENVLQTTVVLSKIRDDRTLENPKTPTEARAIFASLEQRIREVKGVRDVAMASMVPFAERPALEDVAIGAASDRRTVSVRRVTASYFDVLQIRLVAGRLLQATDIVFPDGGAVVSEGFSSTLGFSGGNVLGRSLTIGAAVYRVVGIVGDVRDEGLTREARPTIYVPYSDPTSRGYALRRSILIAFKPSAESQVRQAIEGMIASFRSTGYVSSVTTLASLLAPSLRAPRLYAWVGVIFAALALAISAGGTYAMLAYVTARKQYETAIRMVFGAGSARALRERMWYAFVPIASGLAVGVVVASWVVRGFEASVFRDVSLAVPSVGIAVVVLAVAALAAAAVPAYRASRLDPLTVLRRE